MSELAWPSGRPRVLVSDCWLPNAGDAAIALATQQLIRAHAPGAAIVHAAYGGPLLGNRYPELLLVPPIEALLGTRWAEPDAAVADQGAAFVRAADLVISQGGGFLRRGYEPWSRIDALDRAVDLGPALLVLGQSIGRFEHAFARRTLRRVLRAAVAVVVRDELSLLHATDVTGSRTNVVLGADVAMTLALSNVASPPGDAIGVVLSDHVVPSASPSVDRRAVGIELLRQVLAAHPERSVVLWSTAQGVSGETDDIVAGAAFDALDHSSRSRVELLTGHVDAHRAIELLAASAATVSMRMHPALLGACLGREVALLSGDEKAAALGTGALRAKVYDDADPSAPARCAEQLDVGARPDPHQLLGADLLRRLDATVAAVGAVVGQLR